MGYENTQQAYSQSVGTSSTNYPWIDTRDPTPNDIYYPLGKFWINTSNVTIWYLNSRSNSSGALQSTWEIISRSGVLATLSDNSNTVVYPSPPSATPPDNIQFTSSDSSVNIVADPTSYLIDLSVAGGTTSVEKLVGDDGVNVSPISGVIQTLGNTVANSTYSKPLYSNNPSSNIERFNIQVSAAIASTNINKAGISSFNSAQFTVDANGFVSITNFSPFHYVNVIGPTTYTVLSTDEFISCNTTGGLITIKLPNSPTQYQEFVIKDRTGSASKYNITITTVGGSVTIDGATSYILVSNRSSIQLLFNGTNYEVY